MIKAALLGVVSLIVSLELGAQVMPLSGNNEDLSIYGTDVTEFTWLRGQYTNHGGGAGAMAGGGAVVGGILTTRIPMRTFCAACSAIPMSIPIPVIEPLSS